MSRRQKDPLRPLSDAERRALARLSRSQSAPAAQVARARALLAVAEGQSYTRAAQLVGRHTGDTVARWVAGFNRAGLAAVVSRHGGGHPVCYGEAEQRRILAEAARAPERVRDGTATWSLTTLRNALRRAEDGLPGISTYTIGRTLHAAGLSWQKGRSWCEDEAGPFQAIPQPGSSWRPQGHPAIRPHEYVRGGTCKILTLFHPATGQVHLQPVSSCTNPILHGWLKDRLAVILAALPACAAPTDAVATRAAWEAWQDGLAERFTLPDQLPPLRMLLVWDNLTGHKTAEMVVWLCRHGIMPLYTPLDGQHPHSPDEIGSWFEQTAQAWNQQPTPFLWNGKRRQRRRKQPGDGHAIGGSAARTEQPISPRRRRHHEWLTPRQVTH